MLESGLSGSVRGVSSNGHPYRDPRPTPAVLGASQDRPSWGGQRSFDDLVGCGQKDGFTWDRMTKLADDWLPAPRILHPWPDHRFAVKHSR